MKKKPTYSLPWPIPLFFLVLEYDALLHLIALSHNYINTTTFQIPEHIIYIY